MKNLKPKVGLNFSSFVSNLIFTIFLILLYNLVQSLYVELDRVHRVVRELCAHRAGCCWSLELGAGSCVLACATNSLSSDKSLAMGISCISFSQRTQTDIRFTNAFQHDQPFNQPAAIVQCQRTYQLTGRVGRSVDRFLVQYNNLMVFSQH